MSRDQFINSPSPAQDLQALHVETLLLQYALDARALRSASLSGTPTAETATASAIPQRRGQSGYVEVNASEARCLAFIADVYCVLPFGRPKQPQQIIRLAKPISGRGQPIIQRRADIEQVSGGGRARRICQFNQPLRGEDSALRGHLRESDADIISQGPVELYAVQPPLTGCAA